MENLWNQMRILLREKLVSENAYIENEGRSQSNILTLCLKEIEKEEQSILNASRRKEIMKIRTEINEKENRKTK